MNFLGRVVCGILLACASLEAVSAAPSFQQVGSTLVMSNGNVRLEYNLNAGTTDFYWQNSKKISAFYSGVTLSSGYIEGISYNSWSYSLVSNEQAVVVATGNGLPTMKQYFTLDQTDSFLVRVDLTGTNLSANWMGPVVVDSTGGVNIGVTNDNRALYVPFDNDGFVSYNAMPMNSSSTSYEVGAFYDNTSRNGLVVGSVTHDTWKSGVYFNGANNNLNQMNVFGGATSPWDVMPHGPVRGNTISSPTIFVGFGDDWRTTMQQYAAENTLFAPRKKMWTNGVPFGWNSWGIIQQNINYADAIAVSDFFHTNLEPQGFTNTQGTVHINLDSYWNNLDDFEVQSFVNHCHALGQKAGIYWGPFVWFGTADEATNSYVEGTGNTYTYSDVLLRDTNGNFESVDGGLAMDPSHPGTKEFIQYWVNQYTNYGFDYIKLDFLSHGALEGVHYDTNITTGIEAYNEGMSNVISQINGTMFISESIAPLFPYQYAHSRRIACDAETSLISNTEYTLNSVTYGWWLDDLYQFNDPDVMVFNGYGATTNENQSRLISGAITGIFLDGDDLTSSNGQQAAQTCLTNNAINAVARVGQTFTPIEGNTGEAAANDFVRQDGATWCLAVLNYSAGATNETIDLSRAGLPPGLYVATNLWDGTTTVVTGSLNVSLNTKQSKLFQLGIYVPANLKWSPVNNNGSWDTDTLTDWINQANDLPSVFNTSDNVLFDNTPGVPTTVTVNGTVSPGLITVDSTSNAFDITSGTISGSGGLVKEGPSTLTITSAGNFTGPVTINGGVVYAGNNCFDSVSAITITNDSTMDVGGGTISGNKPVTVSGIGFNGEGVIYNSYNNYPAETLAITLAGDTRFGGTARWDLNTGSQITGPHTLTLDWSANSADNYYGQWNSVTIGADVTGITVTNALSESGAGSSLGFTGMDSSFQNPATFITVNTNCQLDFYSGGFNGSLHILAGGTANLMSAPGAFTGLDIVLEGGSAWQCYGGSADESIDSAITLNGVVHFVIEYYNRDYTNVISGPGGFVSDVYNHASVFSASNTYSGPTVIGSGPQVNLTGNGSISHSSLIFFGGSSATTTHMDVTGRPDETLTLAAGQTLAGIGAINGSLVVSAGATLSPAGTNTTLGITTSSNPVGTLAASNNITLNGTTIIKLDGATNDMIAATGKLIYGGALNLVNISGSPLVAGNSFQIFQAATYSGTFASITPAIPGTGLAWNTNQLATGKISVVTSSDSNLAIASTKMIGGNLILSGGGGIANGTYYVLTTTNLATPLADWTPVATNTFDTSGNFIVTNTIDSNNTQQFYRIK
jgi:autotransporter-associated beta strand protein